MEAKELRLANGSPCAAVVPLDVQIIYDFIPDGGFFPPSLGGGAIERGAEPEEKWFRDDQYAREIIAALERTAPAAGARRRRAA